MSLRVISKENARAFLVDKQGFLRWKGKKGVLNAVRQLECVQTDPIQVVHCNHHLVLHNRVIDYSPQHLDELLYKDRALFEYWCNERSIIPIEDFAYLRYRMKNPEEFHSPFIERLKARRKEFETAVSHVLSRIRKDGPLCSQDFEHVEKGMGKLATKVMNLLWDCGELMIHHVENNRRFFDLTDRVLGSRAETAVSSRGEYERFMLEKYMKAYGLVDTRDWRFGWLSLRSSERKRMVEQLAKEGKIHPVQIEGVKHVYYVLEKDLDTLDKEGPDAKEGIRLVAPLDNLIWNRRMISEIFDFNYAWEVYKVPAKRVYGYYVMPILRGTRFIGRLDPKLDRQKRRMIIASLTLEEEYINESLVNELAEALHRFVQFHQVSKIELGKTKPNQLKGRLSPKLIEAA